jgi:serine/threonine protein phosphatase 1
MKTYTIGDIHGEFNKLEKLINKINPKKEDHLIFLGDYVDRGPKSCEVIDFLIKLKDEVKCTFLVGNHDVTWYNDLFYKDALSTGKFTFDTQGAKATLDSYNNCGINPEDHFNFFRWLQSYFILEDNKSKRIFVHGGFNRHILIEEQKNEEILYWDRDLLMSAISYNGMSNLDKSKYPFKTKDNFTHIYLGHTPTAYWGELTPMYIANLIWLLDTGVGKVSNAELYALEIFSEKLINSK